MNENIRMKAEQAAAVLQNDLFHESFKELEKDIIDRWRTAQDPEKRESLYYELRALGSIRTALVEHINKAAEAETREEGKPGFWRNLWNNIICEG
jgi:hypothetical protein